jgi:hypothetical protein
VDRTDRDAVDGRFDRIEPDLRVERRRRREDRSQVRGQGRIGEEARAVDRRRRGARNDEGGRVVSVAA